MDCDDLMNLTRLFGYVGQVCRGLLSGFLVVMGRCFCRFVFFFVVDEKYIVICHGQMVEF